MINKNMKISINTIPFDSVYVLGTPEELNTFMKLNTKDIEFN